ncbi:hypothetical protein KAFR_0E02970 [Kazachstania africana CBS 2517]|uniref:Glycosyltransferase family 15 protein n=1 Tax=Kazachstania africana (strain ATCC 22294 / BCRC 22015 / CBS 2517 / CECT 1963 / NBRC 1671 / NRRL Y-8276) TaxID=1071382 RepID=H2AVP9_KAZAF|nr:hypothetical protein KAFR_0E02970 [Kazachstania africana CBS 2517]CCF58449.1 hypothetical protein KAFR_0E02970 [Kazachstania africana CBS 2517]
MAIFLSKRLLRFTILVAVSLFVIITLNSHESSSSYVSNFIPSFQFSNSDWSSSEGLSPEEQRLNAAEGKSDLSLDEQAKALQDSADPVTDLATTDVMEFIRPSFENKGKRPKACYVTLVRNSELNSMLNSIRKVEQRFNKQFKYDWIFLNDEPFTDEFKNAVQAEISSTVKFGLIPTEHWSLPEWIDESRATEARFKMAHIIYGGSESYRHMCRFQSGFFWRHPLLDDYDWYWRVEPDINLYCDIKYDVFQWMQDNEKVYGFTISIHEYLDTIPTLWETSMKFFNEHSEYVADNNLMKFISEDNGATYNLCHFWSNFEIANLNLWRSPAYRAYFDALDHAGGFFYERWGDAPVHSIAASILLPKDRIHYFPNIGYHHPPYDNCPLDNLVYSENNCDCKQDNDFTFRGYSCGRQYYAAQGIEKPPYWEKYSH